MHSLTRTSINRSSIRIIPGFHTRPHLSTIQGWPSGALPTQQHYYCEWLRQSSLSAVMSDAISRLRLVYLKRVYPISNRPRQLARHKPPTSVEDDDTPTHIRRRENYCWECMNIIYVFLCLFMSWERIYKRTKRESNSVNRQIRNHCCRHFFRTSLSYNYL